MKKFRARFGKRCLALFLAAAMALTANAPGMDVLTAYAAGQDGGSGAEPENDAAENYRVIVFDDKAEFERIRNNPGVLWEQPEDGSLSSYESRWQSGSDLSTLLEQLSSAGAYAYVKPCNPDVADHTINIPAAMKGVVIDNGWFDEPNSEGEADGEGGGYDFYIVADELNIMGAETCVYFDWTGVDTGESDTLLINFLAEEENASRVAFKGCTVEASIVCESESGTIEFVESNLINGYRTQCTTEVHDYANLCIKEAAGLSFEEITGDKNLTILFNGYPEDTELLPYFHQPISLGKDKDDEGNEYDCNVCVQFWERQELPFWTSIAEGEDVDWWEAVPAVQLEKGAQIAYFVGDTYEQKREIGRNVTYYAHGSQSGGLYLNQATGRLEREGEEEERSAYHVLRLNADSFKEVVGHLEGTIDGEDGSQDILWAEDAYGPQWEEIDDPDVCLGDDGLEYLVLQVRKDSRNSENRVLEISETVKGIVLLSEWDEEAEQQLPWQFDTLKINGATEVYLHETAVEASEMELHILAQDAGSKVRFWRCTVNALIDASAAKGAVSFGKSNILNGYRANPNGVTEFAMDAELLIDDAAGLSFGEIRGEGNVTIVYNGYPENTEYLPYFHQAIDLGTDTDDEGNEYNCNLCVQFWERQELPFGLDGAHDWWEAVPAVQLEKGARIAYFAGDTYAQKRSIGEWVSYYGHGGKSDGLWLNQATGKLEREDEDEERALYEIYVAESAEALRQIREENRDEFFWGDEYRDLWIGVDTLAELMEYLGRDGVEYVALREMGISSGNSESIALEIPANIKGVAMFGSIDTGWPINALRIKGETEVWVCELAIDSMGEDFTVTAEAENTFLRMSNSTVTGGFAASGVADVELVGDTIYGTIQVDGTLLLKGMIVADGLGGYSKLTIDGHSVFVVRDPKAAVMVENCTVVKKGEHSGFDIAYNGYPDASLLPVLKDNIVFPQDCVMDLRFLEEGEGELWWKERDWWSEKAVDLSLPSGTQIAVIGVDGEKFESMKQWLGYYQPKADEQNKISVNLVRTEDGKLLIQQYHSESGKQIVSFALSAGQADSKVYDGKAFAVETDALTNSSGYTGSVDVAWATKEGEALDKAPVDAGNYVLKLSVPADTAGYEGSTQISVTITRKTVTVSARPHAVEIRRSQFQPGEGYTIVWSGFVGRDTYTKQAEAVEGAETTDETGTYYTLGVTGGEAGQNYTVEHGETVRIYITEDTKPCINSVLFPKKKETYSAVYTGEQIRPTMVVAYKYSDDKGKAKTQNLKLNVDYVVTYSDNVNVGEDTAEVTVKGIGEYSGEITKTFSITQKSIAKVTLSAVGDIVYGETPTVTVLDGTYELVEGEDYEITLSTEGAADVDTQSLLKVSGLGNYKDTSKKSVKFNILKRSTEIKDIGSESVTVEFKKLPAKGYTYNGKAQKPAVVVKDGGVKVPASQYKVIYTNNVNAGTDTASVRVVGVSKKGKGYYGVSGEKTFSIKPKDFSKVSVSSVAAVPKTQSLGNSLTMTVKDGKRILTEGVDYEVDYSELCNPDGSIKDTVEIGKKYNVTLTALPGGNYTDSSKKIVKVKCGQLNLASKTAKVSVTIKNAAQNEVEVKYNGVLLTAGKDYTAQVKQDKNKPTYTVTIKAVKKGAYKGSKVFKKMTVESTE